MLGGLFGKRRFLDGEIEDWHLEAWGVLFERFDAEWPFRETQLVLPTRDFFPPTETAGHARAEYLFDIIKTHMGIADWPCRLESQSPRRGGERVSEFVFLEGAEQPGGTFRVEDDGEVVITYSPELVDRPQELIAVLSHELSHYLLSGHADLFADESHELLTDLTTVYAGFGVFGANSAFDFKQHGDAFGQGWSSSRRGYLSPPSWAFALAVFGELKGDDPSFAPHLKPEMEAQRRRGVAYLRKSPERLAALRAMAG